MARGIPLTPEQKAKCREVYAAQGSYRAAARAVGCDDKTAKVVCGMPVTTGETAESAAPAAGRTAQGRFAPGHAPMGGGSVSGTRARRAMVLASISDEEAKAVMRALVDAALAGDASAAVKALGYLIGAPDAETESETVAAEFTIGSAALKAKVEAA